jgi:hypothetical protein
MSVQRLGAEFSDKFKKAEQDPREDKKAPERVHGEAAKALRIFSVLILMAAAFQLVVFKEKPGAHGDHAPAAAPATSSPPSSPHVGH